MYLKSLIKRVEFNFFLLCFLCLFLRDIKVILSFLKVDSPFLISRYGGIERARAGAK